MLYEYDLSAYEYLAGEALDPVSKRVLENLVPPLPEQAHHPGTPGPCSRPIPFQFNAVPVTAFPNDPNAPL